MADPDGSVEVRGTAALNGTVTKRGSEQIVADIDRTREDLARTIDALTDRVSPANNVRRLKELLAVQAARPEVQLAAAAAALAVVGVVIYRIWGRRKG
jgi:hypothetical protein